MSDLAFILSFKPEITWHELPTDESIVLQSRDRKLTFKRPTTGLRTALTTLHAGKGATNLELSQIVQQADGIYELSTFNSHLTKLIGLGWICHGIDSLATAIPLTRDFQFIVSKIDPEQSFTLSRFAYLHQVKGQMILESPLSKAKVCLHDWRGAASIAKLTQPQTIAELVVPTLTTEEIKQFLALLLAAGMLSIETSAVDSKSLEADNSLTQWDFHDLLFHTRSRQGRCDRAMGATYRFADTIEPLPAVKPQMSSKTVQLYKPNLKQPKAQDMSLTEAIETRRSLKTYAQTPITAQELGEFLYRTARVKQLVKTEQGEYTSRPYPSGGGLYELELYPLIDTCTGIDSGCYHYDPLNHQLCQLGKPTKDSERLLKDAWYASGQQDRPQILIAIAARFPRLSWKYESIAYSLVLKHVGSLYQTMYLVATAMNLAPCALGSGNADLFAKVSGTNYYGESSVGEFILGSSPNPR